MSEAPKLPDDEIFYAMPSGSDTVVVAFGANGGGHGHFHFFKLLQPMPGLSKLLVRDPTPRWYNGGLPGVGESLEEIAAGIARELDELRASRVLTFGSSMGGYAAILFGCLLGAERAIAFSPQTLLDPGLRHSPAADVELQAPDLRPAIEAAPGTRVDLVAGWNDHVDVFHTRRVADLSSVRVLALMQRTHSFVLELSDEGRLVGFLTSLIEDEVPEECVIAPSLTPDVEARIAATAYAVQGEDWKTVESRIRPVAEAYPGWAGPNYDLGRALAHLEDWQGAEIAHRRAVEASPRWPQPRAELARALRELGRAEDAERAAAADA